MDQNTKRIVAGLEKAMQAEVEGHHFYKMAAQNTQDVQGREVFQQLADEEQGHFEFLKAQLESITETGQVAGTITLGERRELEPTHPIFSEQIRQRIGDAHYEMTALTIGIQLEKSAVEFYAGEAEAVADPAVKAFYEELKLWEQGHLSALQAEADALKEDYWHEARFAPF